MSLPRGAPDPPHQDTVASLPLGAPDPQHQDTRASSPRGAPDPQNQETHAIAHQTSHCGTENTVWLAQLEPNSIPRNINATTAQTDLSEISTATPAFQDFDDQV